MSTPVWVALFVLALLICLATFLLVLNILPVLQQMRLLMSDLEETSREVRKLAIRVELLSEKLERDLDQASDLLHEAGAGVHHLSQGIQRVGGLWKNTSSGWLAFLPALRLGWTMMKHFRGGRNVR